MATGTDHPPSLRCESPSPTLAPAPAIGAIPELSRCLSTTSDMSHGSGTDYAPRDSLGSDAFSRQSSASYGRRSDVSFASSRQSTYSTDGRTNRRRGYMRPQGTAFAVSAQSRESVMSLGSITHLQYYFARTGLLDGKGAQLQRKNKQNRETMDLSALDTSNLSPRMSSFDADSSYASMGSSPDPDLSTMSFGAGPLEESPIDNQGYDSDDFEEPDPDMLPPTASTYIHREKPVPRPPTIQELKTDLTSSLEKADSALKEARDRMEIADDPASPGRGPGSPLPKTSRHVRQMSKGLGWYEIQGMHILDVMTLAIRAAKMYYTAHEHPERLDLIKSERQIRADLVSVMETLKQMATRRWAGGLRDEEVTNLERWIQSLFDMLKREDEIEQAERAKRASWTWLSDNWEGREAERELAFIASIESYSAESPFPEYTPAKDAQPDQLPTPFLKSFQNGVRLIKLHNAAVKKSKRRFGGITTFHVDTDKPYRCADNLRYWIKAAELRWELNLKVDALGVVYNSNSQVWIDFEAAIFSWCRKAREEIISDLQNDINSATTPAS